MDTQSPLEDINTIVSRFQAWAGAQTPVQSKYGVRELTYEEAVRRHEPRANRRSAAPAQEQTVVSNSTKTKKSAKRASARRPTRSAAHKSATPAAFRQVLAETVAMQPAAQTQSAAMERRTIALSLRVSPAEDQLFRIRAAAANLPVSAYLRQCAMEVEELRMAAKRQTIARTPIRKSAYVMLSQFLRGIFGTKTAALRLRA